MNRFIFTHTVIFILFCSSSLCMGQDRYESTDVDALFSLAQEHAFDGSYQEARDLCEQILERTPDYHEVRILLARTYAWSGMYGEARSNLNMVLSHSPRHKDALRALIDTEMWSEQYGDALEVIDKAVRYYPIEGHYLKKRVQAYINLNEFDNANQALSNLTALHPSNQEITSLRRQIGAKSIQNEVSGSFTMETYSRSYTDAGFGHFEWRRATAIGPVFGRINFAHRFQKEGLQPEIDWYPSISENFYGYLNYGYTSSSLYPDHRFGVELFHRFPYSIEASLGIRHQQFGSEGGVTMYTGALSKYLRNYYLSLRSFLTPDDSGLSRAFTLDIRRYLANADNYIYVSAGMGVSPQDRIRQEAGRDVFLLKSRRGEAGVRKSLSHRILLFGSFSFSRQELLFSPGNYVNIYTINTGITYRF